MVRALREDERPRAQAKAQAQTERGERGPWNARLAKIVSRRAEREVGVSTASASVPPRDTKAPHSVVVRRALPAHGRSGEPLHAFVGRARSVVIERFVAEMRARNLGRGDLARAELIEDLPFFLADLEDALRDPTTTSTCARTLPAASRHGVQRHERGFDLGAILREYALLRQCIFRVAKEHGLSPNLDEIEALDRCVDAAIADAAAAYGRVRDAELAAERRALDEERERLRQAVRSRDDLVAIVSHDLKNPLTAITLSAAQLRREVVRADATRSDRLLDSVERAAHRMTRLIVDLLAIAKIEAGQLRVLAAEIDARTLVDEAVEAIRPLAEHRSIELVVEGPAEVALVACDRERILQVLENLLGNAVKYTPERGTIRVALELVGEHARITVADDGPGIGADAIRHVFDRFWQGPGRTKPGAGLGLAIAKGIVDAHRGQMGVVSDVGRGSSFWFTLPVRAG